MRKLELQTFSKASRYLCTARTVRRRGYTCPQSRLAAPGEQLWAFCRVPSVNCVGAAVKGILLQPR